MRLFRLAGRASEGADPNTFTGEARLTRMTGVSDAPAANAYRVEFQPSARTAWHTNRHAHWYHVGNRQNP